MKSHPLVLVLFLAGACLDTHDASLGAQGEPAPASPVDGGAADADSLPLDAGGDVIEHTDADVEDDDADEERDADTSLLCRLEPWHCT
jgi:hypothetical protein